MRTRATALAGGVVAGAAVGVPRTAFALGNKEEAMVALGFFACVTAVTVAVIVGYLLRGAQRHQTLRAMVEKGMQIPPQLLSERARVPSARADQRRGIFLMCAGLGLGLFLLVADGIQGALLGLIPISVGVGYLVVASMQQKEDAAKLGEADGPGLP
jgi:hypothetical protein